MITRVNTIEVGPIHPALAATIKETDRVLGWDSTRALAWLACQSICGRHVLVAEDHPDYGVVFVEPQLGECSFRFRPYSDGTGVVGRLHGETIRLTAISAYAESTKGHWVSIQLMPDGDIDIHILAEVEMESIIRNAPPSLSLADEERLRLLRRRVGDDALLREDENAVEAALGERPTTTDRQIIDNWRRRVRRQIEDRVRKDRTALAACAAALRIMD